MIELLLCAHELGAPAATGRSPRRDGQQKNTSIDAAFDGRNESLGANGTTSAPASSSATLSM